MELWQHYKRKKQFAIDAKQSFVLSASSSSMKETVKLLKKHSFRTIFTIGNVKSVILSLRKIKGVIIWHVAVDINSAMYVEKIGLNSIMESMTKAEILGLIILFLQLAHATVRTFSLVVASDPVLVSVLQRSYCFPLDAQSF